MLKKLAITLTLLIILNSTLGLALSQQANDAKLALQKADMNIQDMLAAGFGIIRVNDTLNAAKQLYDAQLALENTGRTTSYKDVIAKTDEIAFVRSLAFNTSDQLKAFKIVLDEATSQGVNVTGVKAIYDSAQASFKAERYEEVQKLVDDANKKLSAAKVSSSILNAAIEASTKTIEGFIAKNWVAIIIFLAVASVTIVISYRKIRVYLIKRQIARLNLEKQLVEKLIKKAQHEYFETKTLAEGGYYIKMKKFGELIRDINRQIPVLLEELAKLQKSTSGSMQHYTETKYETKDKKHKRHGKR